MKIYAARKKSNPEGEFSELVKYIDQLINRSGYKCDIIFDSFEDPFFADIYFKDKSGNDIYEFRIAYDNTASKNYRWTITDSDDSDGYESSDRLKRIILNRLNSVI